MASKYQKLIDAVIMGNTVRVPCDETTQSALRTSIWRELKKLQNSERSLGLNHYSSLRIQIRPVGGNYVVRLIDSDPTITFEIVE